MFTGIVEAVGEVRAARRVGDVVRVEIATPSVTADLKVGDSVAVSGCCLTAVSVENGAFSSDLTQETLDRTGFGERLRPGTLVNLERPLKVGGRLDGHIVQGHVDGVGTITSLARTGEAALLDVGVPAALERYLIEKGSVAVDGISLTVSALRPGGFSVAIIPYTLDHTTLRAARPGDRVNLEMDVVARYVERLLGASSPRP